MEEHTLRVLEFDKVIAKLQDQAACAIGREVAGLTYPTTDLEVARRKQQETSEARAILQYEGNIPLGGIEDVRQLVERAAIGALLQPHELLVGPQHAAVIAPAGGVPGEAQAEVSDPRRPGERDRHVRAASRTA